MLADQSGAADPNTLLSTELRRWIRLEVARDDELPQFSPGEGTRCAARSVRRREDEEDEDDEDDDEPPRARKKKPKDDDDDEDDKPAKKPAAKDKKKDKPKKDDDDDEEPEKERRIPKKGSKRYQMYVVANGLATLNGTMVALFAVAGYASLHAFGFQLMEWDRGGTMPFVSQILLTVLLLAMPVAFLVAESFFFITPARADAKAPLMAAVTLQVISLLLALMCFMSGTLVSDEKLALRLREFLIAGANFAFWIGFLMVIGYIKQLYYYLGDKPGGNSASTLGLFFFLVIALGYILFYAGYALVKDMEILYFIVVPGWFLWDGAISRCNVLVLRNIKGVRAKVDDYIWPPEQAAL